MDEQNVFKIYDDLIQKVWDKMVSIVGIHTVTVLVQRSLWLTQQKYAEAGLFRITAEGVFIKELEGVQPEQFKKMMEDFFVSLVDILTRLVGEEITQKIAAELGVFKNEKGGVVR